jgi:integrase
LGAYERAGFPDKLRRPRIDKTRDSEERNATNLRRLLGRMPTSEITVQTCDRYCDLRRQEFAAGSRPGNRTIDLELQTLSNAFNHAVRTGIALRNPLMAGRPRYSLASQARHARDCMPASGDELHRIAHALADDPRSESLAWEYLFLALTGCRTNEILSLRMDAGPRQPGSIEGDWLWVKRSKRGVNPYVLLHPDLRECIDAHRRWHRARFPGCPWWFPGRSAARKGLSVDKSSLAHAMPRAVAALGLNGDRTAHGARAFYVTVRRSAGISDAQIAAEIGDKSVDLISTTYGQIPPGWRGGPELSWRPLEGKAFWEVAA